jgi:hypothetical protein
MGWRQVFELPIRVIGGEVTLSLGLLSPPYPLFPWYLQSKEFIKK